MTPYRYACISEINQNGREVYVYVGFVGEPEGPWSWIPTEPPIYDANAVDASKAFPAKDDTDAYAQANAWIKSQGFKPVPWGCPFHE